MPQADTTDNPKTPHRSGSMILQPEDIVPLTAEEAAADIENAVRTFRRKADDAERRPPPPMNIATLQTGPGATPQRPGRAAPPLERRRGTRLADVGARPETYHEERMRKGRQ